MAATELDAEANKSNFKVRDLEIDMVPDMEVKLVSYIKVDRIPELKNC